MKLKPIRGEIQTTNPMPNLGSSLVDAVKSNAPGEQRVVNTLINLSNREKSNRDALEAQRRKDKNSTMEQKLKARLLESENFVNIGDRDGNLLSPEEVTSNRKTIHNNIKKDLENYYKNDPSAFIDFESMMYNQLNLSTLRINTERKKSIKFYADKTFTQNKINLKNDLNSLPIQNYWIGEDVLRTKYENNISQKAKDGDNTIDVGKEMFAWDQESATILLEKTYTMTDSLGKTVPDYAAIYASLTDTEAVEKLNLDLPGGKIEYLKNRKYTKDIGKILEPALVKEIKEKIKKDLIDQTYIENNQILKRNTKVLTQFEKDLMNPEKLLTLKDLSFYSKQLIGYEKEANISTMKQSILNRMQGKTYTIDERMSGNEILYKIYTGDLTNRDTKFMLPGETEAQSINQRLFSNAFVGTNTFNVEITKAFSVAGEERSEIVNFVNKSEQVKNLVADLGGSIINSDPLLNQVKAEVIGIILEKKNQADKQGKPFNIEDVLNPKSESFIFTNEFIKTYKKDMTDVINYYKSQRGLTSSSVDYPLIGEVNSTVYKNLKKTGIIHGNIPQNKYFDKLNIPIEDRSTYFEADFRNITEYQTSEEYLKWKYTDFPKNKKTSIHFKLNQKYKVFSKDDGDSKFLEYLENNNIKIITE
tara:strand:- start:6 stop:1943 length:1938 start_codon:yes stop_codon:yes gene_type:complete